MTTRCVSNRRAFLQAAGLTTLAASDYVAFLRDAAAQAAAGAPKERFKFDARNIVRPQFTPQSSPRFKDITKDKAVPQVMIDKDKGVVTYVDANGKPVPASESNDQHSILQFKKEDGALMDSFQAELAIDGSEQKPDVRIRPELGGFHLAQSLKADTDTRGVLRLVVNKSDQSTDRQFDKVFWVANAGLKLYDSAKGGKPETKDLSADITRKAFGGRPIEIPGGLADIQFEVVKFKEPNIFQKIWNSFRSEAPTRLLSVLGFPAVSEETLGLLDELLNYISDSDPEVLFKSGIKQYALSKHAKSQYTMGNAAIKLEGLSQGWWILARSKDVESLTRAKPIFDASARVLRPAGTTPADWASAGYKDPFADITYAVMRVQCAEAELDPKFNYGK